VTRVLTIVSAILVLAVSAAPVAAAGPSKKPPPRVNMINAGGGWDPTLRDGLKGKSKPGAIIYNGHAGLGANAIVTDNKDPDKLGVIASVNVKYT
jgi:hypothetical protein